MSKSSKISAQSFSILEEQTFKNISLLEVQEGLDNMFFTFVNIDDQSDNERSVAMYTYFSIKKLLQALKEKTDPDNVSMVEVNLGIYA